MAKIVSQGHKTWKNGSVMNYRITDEGVIYISGNLCDGAIDIKSKSPFHHVVIEDGVTSLGAENFYGLACLEEITLPPTVISIGDKAFIDCANLKRVNFSEGLETIGAEAFLRCKAIEEITIPQTVIKIRDGAFKFCINLSKVTLPPNIDSISNSLFCDCESLKYIKIPSGVTAIGSSAFSGCAAIRKMSLPKGLRRIWPHAFNSCKSLEEINFPKSIKFIDSYAFVGCDKLLNIDLPKKEISLGDCAFSYATKFSFVALDGVKYRCTILNIKIDRYRVILSPEDPENITGELVFPSSVEYGGAVYNVTSVAGCKNAHRLTSVVCPDMVDEIEDSAFMYCHSLKSVRLGRAVRRIGSSAFYYCSSLKDAYLGESLREIGAEAFYRCENLSSLSLPDTLVTIGDKAFEECRWLRIKLPDSVKKIGSDVFKEAYVTRYSHGVVYVGHVLINYDGYLPQHSSLEVRRGTTVIAAGAFKEQLNLEEVILPAGMRIIGDSAFARCSRLKRIKLPASLERIGQWAFSGTPELKEIVAPWRKPISLEPYAIDEKKTVYIPKGTMEAYSQAKNWGECKLVEM